ncbi:MAG TPA: DUF924 family protein [Rhizobacter sp.]|nr:DUF924 family protein [Rhizobacter sp.]
MAAEDVLRFWFEETRPAQWWTVSDAFDQLCLVRFGALHRAAAQGELFGWRTEPRGRLAEVILLDQFSRNLYRGQARAFACDPLALGLAQEAVAGGADQALSPIERTFLYMPYMHSESRVIHVEAERLFRLNGLKDNHDFELRHKAIVDRFGRYPHRNAVLGRESTPEELTFLQQPGSRF